jgi:hypothetical protein
MLRSLLLGEINKFKFWLVLQKKLFLSKMALTFAYDIEKNV